MTTHVILDDVVDFSNQQVDVDQWCGTVCFFSVEEGYAVGTRVAHAQKVKMLLEFLQIFYLNMVYNPCTFRD